MTDQRTRGSADLFSDEALGKIFKRDAAHPDRLVSRESSWLEFKQAFNWSNNAEYAKTMAALANNRGGYIVFGVGNKPRILLGLTNERFDGLDPAQVAEFLNSVLSPEIDWDRYVYESNGKRYGLMYVWESRDKPVMGIRNAGSDIREAEIYYRYRGRSERIKYPELRRLLEEKRANEEALWLQHISQIAKVGIEDAAILDLKSGRARAGGGIILIDESLVPQLRRIAASPTDTESRPELRIEGKIIPSGFIRPTREVATPMVLSSADIIRAFLRQEKVTAPEQYIRQICFESSGYLPVYYFAYLARLGLEELRELVQATKSRTQAKRKLLERVRGVDDHSCAMPTGSGAHSGAKRAWLTRIRQRSVGLDVSAGELSRLLRAVCVLQHDDIEVEYLFPVLLRVFEDHYEGRMGYLVQNLRTALCHLDRVLYRSGVERGENGNR